MAFDDHGMQVITSIVSMPIPRRRLRPCAYRSALWKPWVTESWIAKRMISGEFESMCRSTEDFKLGRCLLFDSQVPIIQGVVQVPHWHWNKIRHKKQRTEYIRMSRYLALFIRLFLMENPPWLWNRLSESIIFLWNLCKYIYILWESIVNPPQKWATFFGEPFLANPRILCLERSAWNGTERRRGTGPRWPRDVFQVWFDYFDKQKRIPVNNRII